MTKKKTAPKATPPETPASIHEALTPSPEDLDMEARFMRSQIHAMPKEAPAPVLADPKGFALCGVCGGVGKAGTVCETDGWTI